MKEINKEPWFVKVLSGVGGWLGAIFLVVFISTFINDIANNNFNFYLIIGIVLSITTIIISIKSYRNYFLKQFILALFLAGEGVIIYWVVETFGYANRFSLALIVLTQGISYIFINNYPGKFLTSLVAITSSCFLLSSLGFSFLVIPVLFAISIILLGKFPQDPITYSLIILALISPFITFSLWNWLIEDFNGFMPIKSPLLYNILLCSIFTVANFVLLFKLFKLDMFKSLLFGVICGTINFFIPGVVIALFFILLGFNYKSKFLFGLGIISTLFYLSHYYYSLDLTLLYKSIILIATGLVSLITRWVLLKKGVING